jgi:type II secretory pathway pseudopilin PulG
MRRAQGFSLLEVLVAFVVLALSLAVVMRIFAGGLDNIGSANRYTQALHLAQSLLDAQGRETPLTMGETSRGNLGGNRGRAGMADFGDAVSDRERSDAGRGTPGATGAYRRQCAMGQGTQDAAQP